MSVRRRRLLQLLFGVVFGLVLTELSFRLRDHGAFPHINLYIPDAKLAVRLRPNSSEKISFSGNPVSSVRINSDGYRGADWGPPGENEILVLGDSQAFGLGVDEDKTFSAELAKKLGRTVIDAGVPTYGPDEYNGVLAELLAKRKPKTVIWTVNMANDLFEASRPNTERHRIWDGWAVRKETAPARMRWFPGRSWLMRDSHAVFALRGLWFRATADDGNAATASEGTYRDLVAAGQDSDSKRRAQEEVTATDRKQRNDAIQQTRQEIAKLNSDLEKLLNEKVPEVEIGAGTLRAARANPGDIVRVYYGEGSRAIPATAAEIKVAADLRNEAEKLLREKGEKAGLDLISRADRLDEALRAKLAATLPAAARVRSPLAPHLVKAKALCDAAGAELVVLVLPLDVQVSDEEWKKYKAKPIDLKGTRVLADDVLAVADQLGARWVDAWPALAAAEPGAFLDGDLHMTPKGHAAVGAALASALGAPARKTPGPVPLPPLGRSPVPTPDEWATAMDMAKKPDNERFYDEQARRAKCRVRQVREWMRVDCPGALAAKLVSKPSDGPKVALPRSEIMTLSKPGGATAVAAQVEGDAFTLVFTWPEPNGRAQKQGLMMHSEWALGEGPYMYAGELYQRFEAQPISDGVKQLCDCHRQVTGAADCSELYGTDEPACMRTYAKDCQAMLRCARGDASSAPMCAAGEAMMGVSHRCVTPLPPPAPPTEAEKKAAKQASVFGVGRKRR
jgi:hypothetical protein